VSGTDITARAPIRRMSGAAGWMTTSFAVALALAVTVLAISGDGESGTALALRITARWCFVLFWPAYAGGALVKFWGARFAVLARYGREFGLAFAAALSVHIGLVLWLLDVAAKQRTLMLFFWAGVACTYMLAAFSLPRLRDRLGLRLGGH
jgi:hypothetical protein